MGNVSLCPGSTVNISLPKICCRRGGSADPNPKPKPKRKRNHNKVIVFKRLESELDYSMMFNRDRNDEGINLIVNSKNYVIGGRSENVSNMFDTKVDNLVGMNLDEIEEHVPPSIVQMIREIITSVYESRGMVGCQVAISDANGTTDHILCAFPIVDKANLNSTIYSVMLFKQPYHGILDHRAILTRLDRPAIVMPEEELDDPLNQTGDEPK